ncbi:MAG: helix-turn-helix domain-containing protein [Actinobacteria bacterium]|nr:helix-turn-helix domain-containing protein [Actinomycetota bacterium]
MAPNRRHTPTVRLRRLAAELRRLRAAADLSRDDASRHTGINHATLYRIETAKARPQMRTLAALLTLYGVDTEQRESLTNLCREAGTQGWLRPYHSDLPEEYTAYISFEDDAAGVRNYQSLFIPGLLQTEDYARAVIRSVLPWATDTEVADRVQARMDRQGVLTKAAPLTLWAIVDEAALHRVVGGADVMRAQLRHLTEAVKAPNITFQVIPFGAGAHPGMPGAFVLMDFSDPMDTDLIHIDSMAGDLFLEADADVRRYTSIFDNLRAIALSPDDSASLVVELTRETG